MTSATTKTAHLSEEDMLVRLANDVLRGDTNNIGVGSDANDNSNNNNDDDHRTIMSNGGDTWVTIKSTATAATSVIAATMSASPSSVVSPLDESIVSPPLLSDSVDQSLTNDLASAMAYALNMPTAREITEVLQDLYILPDYRMANDGEYIYYSDTDDYSTSSSEHENAHQQQQRKSRRPSASAIYSSKAKKKSKSGTKALGHRRSQFRSNEAKKSTRATGGNATRRIQSSKDKASGKKANQSPSLRKNNGDKLIGLRILLRKKDRSTNSRVPKTKTVPRPFVKKTPVDNRNSPDKGRAVKSGFFVPGLSTASMGLDASDADDLLPNIDDFITSYGMTVEKTIADIKSAVDAVKTADANDVAYAVLGRPTLPDVPPSTSSTNKKRKDASSKRIASKSEKKDAARKAKNTAKIEVLGLNRLSSQPNDESCDERGTNLVAWSQKKLKAISLVIKSAPSLRSKYEPSKPPGTMEARASRHKIYRFKIGRCFDHVSEAGITTSPRSFLRFGQRSNDSHDSCQHYSHPDHFDTTMNQRTRAPTTQEDSPLPPQGGMDKAEVPVETDIDSDDEMINHRARITVTRPSSAMHPLDPDSNLLNISTDTPIGINCDESTKASAKPANAPVESHASKKEVPCGTDGGDAEVPKAHVQVKSTIGTKWTKSTALVRSSLSKMQWRKIQQVPASLGSAADADADATCRGVHVPSQMDEDLLVKIAGLADELYDDALPPSMSILRATKIIERYPENVERLVASLERRVKEKKSASAAKTTPKKMSTLLDLTALTDGTGDMSSPDTSPSSKSGADLLASNHGPDVSMLGEEIGVEWNLSAVQLDEPIEAEDQLDVEMNISLSSNGVEIYFDIGNDGVATNAVQSNLENEHFLRELSVKLELYMRLEAIYGKAETEEHAQRRLQAVLERFEGREQVVLLALRRQMELHTSTCTQPSMSAKAKGSDQPTCTQEEAQPSLSMESSLYFDGMNLSAGDDIYDADISADLDNLLLDGPAEI